MNYLSAVHDMGVMFVVSTANAGVSYPLKTWCNRSQTIDTPMRAVIRTTPLRTIYSGFGSNLLMTGFYSTLPLWNWKVISLASNEGKRPLSFVEHAFLTTCSGVAMSLLLAPLQARIVNANLGQNAPVPIRHSYRAWPLLLFKDGVTTLLWFEIGPNLRDRWGKEGCLLGGALVTAFGIAIQPLETVRNRMLVDLGSKVYRSVLHAFRSIHRGGGMRAMFRAWPVRLMSGVVSTIYLANTGEQK